MGTIRFILAVSVLIVHSGPIFGITILPGYLAVQSFYIISGFYMTLVFTEKYEKTEKPLWNFYSNRLLRLMPLYWLIVLLTLGLSLIYGVTLGSFGKIQYYLDWYAKQPDSLGSLTTVSIFNITLIGQDWLSFFEINAAGSLSFMGFTSDPKLQELLFIPIAWTIAVEIFFYALTPYLAKRSIQFLLLCITFIVLLRWVLYEWFNVGGTFSVYRFAPTELFWFLLGMISYKTGDYYQKSLQRYKWVTLMALITTLFTYRIHQFDLIVFGLVTICTPPLFFGFQKSPIDRWIGELTYPLYLGHLFLLMIVGANRFPKPLGAGLPLLVLTVIFSILVYLYFVKPIEQYRSKRLGS